MNIVTVLFFVMYVARDSKTQDSVAGSYGSYEHMIADQDEGNDGNDEGNDANMKTEKGITTFQGDRYLCLFYLFNLMISIMHAYFPRQTCGRRCAR